MTAKPAAPAARAIGSNDTALELGGGAIAILALGAAALAVARRRRREEEEQWYGEEAPVEEHVEPVAATAAEPLANPVAKAQPAIIAPAAFSWGNPGRAEPEKADDGSDRRPGESWVERAYRGQSPANPSASLRARLKRAAFFDKREREVAAGKAEPVETGAGLPDVLADERPAEAVREFA